MAVTNTITSLETYAQGWNQWPLCARNVANRARKHGWDVRIGFSRGPMPGRKEGVTETRDIIGVWVDGYGHRAAAFWERNPDAVFTDAKLAAGVGDGDIPSGMQWKAQGTAIWHSAANKTCPCYPGAGHARFSAWLVSRSTAPGLWLVKG